MTEEEEIELTVDVKRGMADGDKIKYDQIADELVGHIAGDLVFVIQQVPDQFFTRNGDDLSVSIEISLLEALVGFDKEIKHLDGHAVQIAKSTVSQCNEVIRIAGQGMPRKAAGRGGVTSFGDLFVTLRIVFPPQLSEAQKTQLRQTLGK
jgi:DnaJ-class molecular chaperone